MREQRGLDAVVLDLTGQPVAAQHEPVAVQRRQQPVVRLQHLGAADGAGDHVPLRMPLGAGGIEHPAVEQLLHHRVVDADLLEPPLGEPVGPRVAEVGDQPVRGAVVHDADRGGDRRPGSAVGEGTDPHVGLLEDLADVAGLDRPLRQARISSTRIALAWSPAAWPPIPSATT